MTWICKKCGQIQSDSIIYGDELCDDCFDKLHEKKNKKRGFFYRFVSFALVLSIVLCLLTGYASAEDSNYTSANTSTVGSYLGYDMIKYDPNELISYQFFVDQLYKYNSIDPSINYVYFVLLDFDSSGVPSIYSAGSSRRFATIYYEQGNSSNPYQITFNGSMGFSQDIVTPKDTSYYYTSLNFFFDDNNYYYTYKQSNKTYPEVYYYPIDYTNGVSGFNGFSGTGNTYLAIVPYASSNNNISSVLGSLQTGTLDDVQLSPVLKSPHIYSNQFMYSEDISNAVNTGNGWVGIEYYNDMYSGTYMQWINVQGAVIPYLTFDIHDNGNMHNYEFVIEYNSDLAGESLKYLSNTYGENNSVKQWMIDNGMSWIWEGLSNLNEHRPSFEDTVIDSLEDYTSWTLENPYRYTFDKAFSISSSVFNFSDSDFDGFRRVKINLNDYMTVLDTLMYRCYWKDKNTGEIIWNGFFATPDRFTKLSSATGLQYHNYNYGDYNGLPLQFFESGYEVSKDYTVSGDEFNHTDIKNPVIDESGQTNWNNIDLGGMYAPLNFGLSAVSDFFQSLWVIFPVEIRTIIISGMSLIVVLRILGR